MRICFLSLNSYPILTNKNLGYAGGAEVEQVHLGRELASNGYAVSFVTYGAGHCQIENSDGIQIIKAYKREEAAHLDGISKYLSILIALKKANADLYFHEAGAYGVLPFFCFLAKKKFVYRIASDLIVLSKPLLGNYGLTEKVLNILEIKRADVVIAQSNFQMRIIKERFGVEPVVMKNGSTIGEEGCEKPKPPIILWVGSLSSVKQPFLFLELAKSIPYARFEMLGGRSTDEPQLYDEVVALSQKLPNIKFYGFVPYNKVIENFRRASIFVSTSKVEGFPNTFIQAWAHHIPVVSLNVDPDGVIKNENVGFHSCTFKQLVTDITILLSDEQLRERMGENGRAYVEREHDIKKIVSKYSALFSGLLQ